MSEYIMRSTDDSSIEVVRPDNSSFRLIEVTGELSALLARAEKAEAALAAKQNSGSDGPIDWQRVRIDAAIAAMQGIVSGRALSATIAAELAKDYADALVAELKEEKAE